MSLIGQDVNLRGALGWKGERGYSAYEIAVEHGFTGTEEEKMHLLDDIRKAAEDISNDPTAALITAVEEYVRCKKQVIYLEERKKH